MTCSPPSAPLSSRSLVPNFVARAYPCYPVCRTILWTQLQNFWDTPGFTKNLTPAQLAEKRQSELKNGRLAMIAMLGVFVQGATTGEGPAANWGKHVADPFGYNFVTIAGVERTPVL